MTTAPALLPVVSNVPAIVVVPPLAGMLRTNSPCPLSWVQLAISWMLTAKAPGPVTVARDGDVLRLWGHPGVDVHGDGDGAVEVGARHWGAGVGPGRSGGQGEQRPRYGDEQHAAGVVTR